MKKESNRKILHYEIAGAEEGAKWLVFVHGAGGSFRTWKFQIEHFSKDFRLLLIDLRDHGYSKEMTPAYNAYDFDIIASDILKVIDKLSIKKAHFMSLSLGSVILQKIDIMRPKLIAKMVMAGAIFDGSNSLYAFAHLGKLLTYILPFRVLYSLFSFIVLPRKNHRLSRYIFRKQSKRMTSVEYLKWVQLYKPFFKLIKEYVKRDLTRPCLIVMGDQDHIFLSSAKKFASNQKNAVLSIVKGCGHVVSIESPKIFNQIASDFFNGLDTPESVQADQPIPYKWKDLKALGG
jgi:pimeloyl-ACP methyl ester carboxylesterase